MKHNKFQLIYWGRNGQAYFLRDTDAAAKPVGLGFVRRFLARSDVQKLSPMPGRGVYGVGVPPHEPFPLGGIAITTAGGKVVCVIRHPKPFLEKIESLKQTP